MPSTNGLEMTLYPSSRSDTPWHAVLVGLACTPAIVCAYQVGTGGGQTAQYYKARGEKGYPFAKFEADSVDGNRIPSPTASEKLATIRDVFKLPVTRVAELFGVTRQAVHDWQNGKQLSDSNAVKLDNVSRTAEVLQLSGLSVSSLMLGRKLTGGKTLLDIAAEGGDAEGAAHKLVAMLRNEAQRRKRISESLAAQRTTGVATDQSAPVFI